MTKTNERLESARIALETCAPEMREFWKNELAAAKADRREILANAAKFATTEVLQRTASRKKNLHCPECNNEFTGGVTCWSCVDKMFNQ